MIGPYFAMTFLRVGSKASSGFLSHWRLVMIGIETGPGGNLLGV